MGPDSFRASMAAMIAMRVVYAINWFNIGAIFYAMEPDLGSGVVGLGTLTSAFFLGASVFQIPGGIMAAKWGPKKTVVLGTFVSSASAFATGFGHDILTVAALRFVVGGGMALVFAPGVVIMARILTERRSGLGVGLFNSTFDMGGVIALFLWGVIAGTVGWRPSVELSGAMGIVSGLILLPAVSPDSSALEFRVTGSGLWRVLADRRLLTIGVGMIALNVGNVTISGFMEYYLIRTFGVSAAEAGIITSMIVAVPIFSHLYAGRTYDTAKRPRFLLILSNVIMAVALLVAALQSVGTALVCSVLGGLFCGFGFTAGFAAAKDLHTATKEYDSLAVGWVNGLSFVGAFLPPLVFSNVADRSGYPAGWVVAAAMTLLLTIPLLFLREGPAKAERPQSPSFSSPLGGRRHRSL